MGIIQVISGPLAGTVFRLERQRIEIGREAQDINLSRDNNVSRLHAIITNENDKYILQDAGSANGTFINSERISRYELSNGDAIAIGQSVFRFFDEDQTSNADTTVHIPSYHAPQYQTSPMQNEHERRLRSANSTKLAAGIIGILLGELGIHKFILGLTTQGLIMLLVTVLTCGIGAIIMWPIALIEGIIYLTKTDEDFYEIYVVGKKPWF